MNVSLHNFENWLSTHRPEFLTELNDGATPDAIATLNQKLAGRIPDEFCSYLLWHDGQSAASETLYENVRLMPTREILNAIKIFKECVEAGEFEDNWWQTTWLPFTTDGGGNHIVLDCESGAVREFWKSDPDRPVIAQSFSNWLNGIVEMFSADDWVRERGAFKRVKESTPAAPYEKVSVVLLHAPTGGLAALKSVYEKSLPLIGNRKTGIGQQMWTSHAANWDLLH